MNDRVKVRLLVAIVVIAVMAVIATLSVVILAPRHSPTLPSTQSGSTDCAATRGSASPGNWTTYHRDNTRGGALPTGGASVKAGWLRPLDVDGQVYAEPLACGNSVFVATEHDSVYAINSTDGSVVWHTHMGSPMPGSSLPCGDIDPSGITGTPVIDVATGTLYAVAFVSPGHHVLFGLNVVNGSIRSEVTVDPAGADPIVEQQRGALTLANGYVYVVYGGLYGDCGNYHGWVVGVPVASSGGPVSYQVPTQREGAIWGPAGTAVSSNGNLYVSTGNGASTTSFDHGDSVIELSPGLTELGFFAPGNWAQLNRDDTDLGSVAPTILPNGDIFQIGKAGVGYLLSGSALGGIGGEMVNASVCGGAYGGTAHVNFSVFVPCMDGLVDVRVSASSLSVAWRTSSFDAGSPIVTGDVVWAVSLSTSDLVGFNASDGQPLFSFPLGSADHFISPTATPGRLFVAAGEQVFAFALS